MHMTTEGKGKLFILFVPLSTLSLLNKIVCSLLERFKHRHDKVQLAFLNRSFQNTYEKLAEAVNVKWNLLIFAPRNLRLVHGNSN